MIVFLAEVQAKADKALGYLGAINDTQIAHTLMRQCTGFGSTVFAIRTTPPHLLGAATSAFDEACAAATEAHITRWTRWPSCLGARLHRNAACPWPSTTWPGPRITATPTSLTGFA